MEFNNEMFDWENEGTEPSENLKKTGFQGGYRPPASVFNHFWSTVSKAIKEIQEGLSNVDNTADSAKPVSTAQATAIADAKKAGTDAQSSIASHTSNKSNPHGVTKSQIGLGNVDNTSDANKPVSTAQATAIADAKKAGTDAQSDIDAHIENTANPHGVTKSQVGLGSVPNVSTNDQTPTYTAATSLTALTSGEKLSVAFGKIAKAVSDLISHIANKSNPHGVTKAQVGLGNVDNTSDADKPVSTAQATSIADAKKAGTDAQSSIASHTANTSNPHSVTKSQVGLSNVPNVTTNNQTPTYTAATSLSALKSGETLSTAFGKIAKAVSDLISHIANTSNPHGVTKSQVGLSNVDNTADSAKPVSTAQATAIADAKAAGTTAQTNLSSHTGNKSNPHGVTKSQVGLGNVDNTADANKTVKSAGTCTGNSATASKLNTDAGDSNTPVYFSNGVPVACTGLDLNTTGSAAKWTTKRKLTLSGDVSGSVEFDGSGDMSITTTVADDSHNHVIGNVDGLQDALNAAKIPIVTTAGTGAAYTATVEGMDALTTGAMVVIVPHTVSTSTSATLNVNSLGAKQIRQITSYASGAAVAPASASFLASGNPVLLMYNGTYWVQLIGRANASDFYGTLPVAKGGTGATDAATARTNLGAFPSAGGTLTGSLGVSGGYCFIVANATSLHIVSRTVKSSDTDAYRKIRIRNSEDSNGHVKYGVDLIDYTGDTTNYYNLWGNHNKPRGYYTGNGSATSRTIDIGAIGSMVVIEGANGMAIIGPNGGTYINSSGTSGQLSASEANYSEGSLVLATTNTVVNANGKTVTVQAI